MVSVSERSVPAEIDFTSASPSMPAMYDSITMGPPSRRVPNRDGDEACDAIEDDAAHDQEPHRSERREERVDLRGRRRARDDRARDLDDERRREERRADRDRGRDRRREIVDGVQERMLWNGGDGERVSDARGTTGRQ